MTTLPIKQAVTPLRQRMLDDMAMRGLSDAPGATTSARSAPSQPSWVGLPTPRPPRYLARLAAIHAALIAHDDLPGGLAHSYSRSLGLKPAALRDVIAAFVQRRYEQVVRPVAQIAENQGFPAGWRSVNDR